MNDSNDAFVLQLLETIDRQISDELPEFSSEMSSWEIVSSVRHKIPDHEQKILDVIFRAC
jgi:hypothetical protein